MKRNMIKEKLFFILLLCLLLGLCMTACKQEQKKPVSSENSSDKEEQEEVKKTESGHYLVKDGVTEYQIVIPESTTEMLTEASKELQYFIEEATGVTVKVVTDNTVKETERVISLGRTGVAASLGVATTEEDDLGTSGYLIKTVDSSVVIMDDVKGDGEGVLYGVYDFLEDAIGLTIYAADEIAYEQPESIPIYEYDEIVKPSFDIRSLTYNEIRTDDTYKRRMRLIDLYDWEKLGIYGHTQVSRVLSVKGEHPEWYASGINQLCWSAGDEMETAFANNLIEIIKSKPDAVYFHLGQEDVTEACSCEKCKANIAADKYGNYAGLQIAFLNHVIEKVEAWRKAEAPERDIRFICYAYYMTFEPPVKKDSSGNIVANHKDCIPADNLYIFLTPIGGDYATTLEDAVNTMTLDATKGWGAIAPDRVMIYEYDCNYHNYLLYFNNFEVVQSHYDTFAENGVTFMYSQGPVTAKIPCFTEMRLYVESQLMWDLGKEYDVLVNDFMKGYYKDAAKEMRAYYDYIRKINDTYKNSGGKGGIYANIGEAYSIENVKEMDTLLDAALQAIEPHRNTNNELFKTLYYRIKKESISSLWLKLSKYDLAYSEEEMERISLEFYYLCEKYGIEYYAEGNAIGSMFYQYLPE